MTDMTLTSVIPVPEARPRSRTRPTEEPRWLRWNVTGVVLALLAILVLAPRARPSSSRSRSRLWRCPSMPPSGSRRPGC